MQFTADLIGCTLRASALPELSALGASFAGLIGLDVYRSELDLKQLVMDYVDYHPVVERETASRLYTDWLRATQRVL